MPASTSGGTYHSITTITTISISRTLLRLISFSLAISLCSSYLIIVNETSEPGTILFNASVYKLGSERHYKINAHKSAFFVHHLIEVDKKDGQIRLKKPLECNGIFYPNLFTFYVDSTSNRLRSIDYYSLPIRVFIAGRDCNDESQFEMHGRHFEEEDSGYSKRRRRRSTTNDLETNFLTHNHNESRNFRDGDLIFGDDLDNELRHKLLSRKRRSHMGQLPSKIHRKITDAKQWISETYASYAIHTTDKWNQICLKKSQFVNNLNAFLPKTICQNCKVNFLDVNDERFVIETQNRDLVASRDICITEPMWKVIITFNIRCNRSDIVDADHRLKIVYHHQEFNDTDIAKRVRRELRNQSPYFEQALYVASVLEEQPAGVSVATVRARDPEDSPVVYSMVSILDSRSQSLFKVDSRTGVVTTSAGLDRELMDVHYFRIVATDDSFPPRSGEFFLN